MYQVILEKAQAYVEQLHREHSQPGMYFHNLQHTFNVVKACLLIAEHESLADEDKFAIYIAALFHDIGYLYQYEGHEERGMFIAGNYLLQQGCNKSIIKKVQGCIRATKMPQQPRNLCEEIICDADFYHLSLPDYLDYSDKLKHEWEVHSEKFFSNREWLSNNLNFLQSHSYFTNYGKTVLQKSKEENINHLTHLINQGGI